MKKATYFYVAFYKKYLKIFYFDAFAALSASASACLS